VPVTEPMGGRQWLAEDKDLWAVRQMLRAGSISLFGWLGSVARTDEFAYLDARDIAPSWQFASQLVTGLMRDRLKRRRIYSGVATHPASSRGTSA